MQHSHGNTGVQAYKSGFAAQAAYEGGIDKGKQLQLKPENLTVRGSESLVGLAVHRAVRAGLSFLPKEHVSEPIVVSFTSARCVVSWCAHSGPDVLIRI